MAYRNKTYVCFDGDKDMPLYRLMQAWKQNENIPFDFYNAHDLNTARDSSQEESIKRQLRERLQNSKLMIVLVGEGTRYLQKFVRWEMEAALKMDLPLIAANLNGQKQRDSTRCPSAIKDELAIHISFGSRIMQHALENWPDRHRALKAAGKTGPYHYTEETYKRLGIT